VDVLVDAAAGGRLPHAGALRETVRRRRASGGPAEQTFATLVGLQLRPRRLREAAALWARITEEQGLEARDALWAHPDLLPTSAHLDDPASWGATSAEPGTGDWDAALRDLDADLDGHPDEPGPSGT
jgi:putative hydrolase